MTQVNVPLAGFLRLLPKLQPRTVLTFKDVLELVLLQAGPHGLLNGRDVLVQFHHQWIVVHALHISHDGIIALLRQGDQVMETMHPESRRGRTKKFREGKQKVED